MTLRYTWQITQIKTADVTNKYGELLKDAVVHVSWVKTGSDQTAATGEFVGATPLDPSNTKLDDFKGLSDLSESDILSWIQAIVVGDYAAHVDGKIQEQIEARKVRQTPLPWQSI